MPEIEHDLQFTDGQALMAIFSTSGEKEIFRFFISTETKVSFSTMHVDNTGYPTDRTAEALNHSIASAGDRTQSTLQQNSEGHSRWEIPRGVLCGSFGRQALAYVRLHQESTIANCLSRIFAWSHCEKILVIW